MSDETNELFSEVLTEAETDATYSLGTTPHLLPYWWRCRRYGPISGTYKGVSTSPNPGSISLDLRVDIDPCHKYAQVLNRVSGDLYRVYQFGRYKWQKYYSSWIIDKPIITWTKCAVEIKGTLRYLGGLHLLTKVLIVIPWNRLQIGPAKVTFTTLWYNLTFTCTKKSNYFREVPLEVDVCSSQNSPPILPSYHTHNHSDRPVDIPGRNLTVSEAYKEAGVNMTINPVHTVIDDSANPTWNKAELHNMMELHFSRYSGHVPTWAYWVLVATSYINPGVAGIMFDNIISSPDRQGSAIFKAHSVFNNLPAGTPVNDAQADALRFYLFCYVHEIGHGFNLLHSWQKSLADPPQPNRPNSLSWMNYPQYVTDYWSNFRFRFDEDELIHIRHGNRNAVIFGGKPFLTGAALTSIPEITGEIPLDVIIRSKEEFNLLEPIILELKIKNQTDDPIDIATNLEPEYRTTTLLIEQPDGTTLLYDPVMCIVGDTETNQFDPGKSQYQNIMVSFGKHGHYFKKPGTYRVQVSYQGTGNMLITSDIHELRVLPPSSKEEEVTAAKYHRNDVGMALYLEGSDSEFLKPAMSTLESMAQEFQETPVGAHISLLLAKNLTETFHDVKDQKRVLIRKPDPRQAITLIDRALEQQERDDSTFQNITYHRGIRIKTDMLSILGEKKEAKKELKDLIAYLENRNVKKHVLDQIDVYSKTI
ncbi:hypothetical protein ES703_14827 [subsurface metagenome]